MDLVPAQHDEVHGLLQSLAKLLEDGPCCCANVDTAGGGEPDLLQGGSNEVQPSTSILDCVSTALERGEETVGGGRRHSQYLRRLIHLERTPVGECLHQLECMFGGAYNAVAVEVRHGGRLTHDIAHMRIGGESMSMGMSRVADRVAVVGGGPVGMCAAMVLASVGVGVDLYEANPTPMPDWRASTFHAPTLELLDRIGVSARMHEEGLVVPRYQFRDRKAGLVAEYDFGLLADETPFPYRLQLNQQRLVTILHEMLLTMPNVEVRFGKRVTSIVSDASGSKIGFVDASGLSASAEYRFVVAADGARSTVRSLLDIPFEGVTYPERFLIVSTPVDMGALIMDLAPVNYIADPEEWLFILRTPESWRVLWPVPEGISDAEALSEEEIERHLQGVAPRVGPYDILDSQIYAVHQRVAERFLVGSTLLIGDAAHINSPVGGVGLNSGIHDAFDVAERIGRVVLNGADPEQELTAFEVIRRKVALEYVQADTERNTQRLRERDEAQRARNIEEMKALALDTEAQRKYLRRVSLLESFRRFGVGRSVEEIA